MSLRAGVPYAQGVLVATLVSLLCSEKPKVMDMTSTRETFSTTCSFRIHNKPVNKLWEWTAVPSVPVTAKAMLPSTSAVTIELAHGVKMITFVNTVRASLCVSSCRTN